jgi:hypothetical protein
MPKLAPADDERDDLASIEEASVSFEESEDGPGVAEVLAAVRAQRLQLPADAPRFIASNNFDGPRPGYFFGKGENGLGYYIDE